MAEKITESFLEENIKEPVAKFTSGEGSKKGDNVAGTLLAIKATGKSGKVHNMVYKYLTDDPMQRGWAVEFGIFKTEEVVYTELLPYLEKFIAKHNTSSIPYSTPVPKFYSGSNEGDNVYICLEDVRPDGYVMPDKFQGLTLEETTLIMKKLAEFHAASYFLIRYEGQKVFDENESFKRIRHSAWSVETPETREMGKKMFGGCVKSSLELIEKTDPELGKRLSENTILNDANQVYDIMHKISADTDKLYFPCIIHGDFWLNNILIKYDNGDKTKPVDLKFIDFQMTRYSNIFVELNYFIMCSTTPEFRKNHLEQVLKVYYESFCGLLARVKCPVPIGFTRGFLVDTMYQFLLPGFIYLAFALPMQLADPVDFQGQMMEAATKLGVDPSLLAPPPQQENNENSEIQKGTPPPPSPEQLDLFFKMRHCMLFLQMEKSERGMQRLMQVTQEMVDHNIL